MNPETSFVRRWLAGLRALSPNCREASRLQSRALDEPLCFPRRLGLRIHLVLCVWCRRYGKQLRFLRHAAHDHPDRLNDTAPSRLSPEARERLRQALQDPRR